MARVKWKLREYLDGHGITAYQLGKELGGQTRMPNLYRLINTADGPSRVDLNMLGDIIVALERMTKEKIDVCTLLEFQRD